MANDSDPVGRRVDDLDLRLFESVFSQSSAGDRQSWLAVQRAIRRPGGYVYLEIGSHLGGSIQQHVIDPLCKRIISIDKRPLAQPDNRLGVDHYEGNSTARMLDNLRQVAPDQLDKITCYDADAKDIDSRTLPGAADFCFIDGEHTDAAVLSDFEFCLSVCTPNAAICFHDDYILSSALRTILASLSRRQIPFVARKLGGATFGIFLRACPAESDPHIRSCSRDAYSWLRGRHMHNLVPDWLHPTVKKIENLVKGRPATT